MDKILMLRKEGLMGAREESIGMRRQAPEPGPMRYAYAWPARDKSETTILFLGSEPIYPQSV